MYKIVPQTHYNLPDGMYQIQAFNDERKPIKPKMSDLEGLIQQTIEVGEQSYKIMTIMYDLGTEKYFALCRVIEPNKE